MLFNYVADPNSNLLCCICRMPFVQPVSTRTCSHTFCSDCIIQAISHARQCPVDRSPLSVDDLLPANSIIRSLVDELIVECVHRTSGCTHTCQRQQLHSHLKDTCPYSRVDCPKGECGERLARKDAAAHQCVHKFVLCDSCGVNIQLDQLENHTSECADTVVTCDSCALELHRFDWVSHKNACPAAIISCPQAPNGCGWTGPREGLASSHIPFCPFEAIKGFFALNTTKFERIAEENLVLRHKVDTLESTVHTMKRELQSVKTALGPWYRPDGAYAYSRPSADLPPDLQPASASSSMTRRYSQAGDAPPTRPMATPFDHAPRQDVYAAYFPSEAPEEPYPPAAFDLAARRRTLPAGWEPHFGNLSPNAPAPAPAHAHGRPAAQLAVAPLNLSTTLEGALAGMRESVVALGGAVDSLGRRNDIALTNEALRLNEEVMSLRANVHGLRMQARLIMMDRNALATGRSSDVNMLGGDGAWPSLPRFYYPQMSSPPGQSITKL
ncbi:hypothetical protein B0H15DRAFT_893387 [Mycena belliarum]|uniref:Uncharacterized protein n=1 Tax=Mycena belliarum TaxID=1033014 RepID=A0AAD6TQT1_9AGAR|nr:hypothetical protein B0H15DRAFT_893387 [Mycena belliae]